jgi:hypothetical protein
VLASLLQLDALRDVKEAKALLKVTLPQLVQVRLAMEKKEQILAQHKSSLQDATEYGNGLKVQITREKKDAQKRITEVEEHRL